MASMYAVVIIGKLKTRPHFPRILKIVNHGAGAGGRALHLFARLNFT